MLARMTEWFSIDSDFIPQGKRGGGERDEPLCPPPFWSLPRFSYPFPMGATTPRHLFAPAYICCLLRQRPSETHRGARRTIKPSSSRSIVMWGWSMMAREAGFGLAVTLRLRFALAYRGECICELVQQRTQHHVYSNAIRGQCPGVNYRKLPSVPPRPQIYSQKRSRVARCRPSHSETLLPRHQFRNPPARACQGPSLRHVCHRTLVRLA